MTQCVAIIQARLNSSRLPGKALLPLAGTTVLGLMIARVKVAKKVDQIIVATTSNTVDDPLCEEARKHGVSVFAVPSKTFWIAFTVLPQSMEQL